MAPPKRKVIEAPEKAAPPAVDAGSRLLTEERRRAIVEIVNRDGRVMVSKLARQFGVSVVTARTDIDALAERDLLVRSHGGALRKSDIALDSPLDVKATLHHDEKIRIGQAAAALVRDGQTVLLDSGTTTLEVARALRQHNFSQLTIVTNSLSIALELCSYPHVSLILIGGLLRQISRSFVGPQAEKMLADLHVDHLFLGVDGLQLEYGPSTPDILEAELNAAMIRAARETTVVADSSKIGRRSLTVIAPITCVRRIITDKALDAASRAALEAKGIEVLAV